MPVAWEIVIEDTGLPILYGGRLTSIDAWVVRCGGDLAVDVSPRSKRGSGHHVRQILRRTRERLPHPDAAILYRTGARPRWWREGLVTRALIERPGWRERVQAQTRPGHEGGWAAAEVWGLSQDLARTAPHETIQEARRIAQAWAARREPREGT